MHLISLAFLRFVEYMSAVYIDEEFGDLYQPEDPYDYWKRQVTRLKHLPIPCVHSMFASQLIALGIFISANRKRMIMPSNSV